MASKVRISPWVNFILNVRSRTVRNMLAPFVRGRVLDVGCADGAVAELLSREEQVVSIAGVDTELFPEAKIPVKQYDGLHLPWDDKEFDTVICSFVLHHSEKPDVLLDEMRRVGEHVVILEDRVDVESSKSTVIFLHDRMNNTWHMDYSPDGFHTAEEWNLIFKEHGFQVVAQQNLPSVIAFLPTLKHHLFVLAANDSDNAPTWYKDIPVDPGFAVNYHVKMVNTVTICVLVSLALLIRQVLLAVMRKGPRLVTPPSHPKVD